MAYIGKTPIVGNFDTLNSQELNEWIVGIKASMPSNPKENN